MPTITHTTWAARHPAVAALLFRAVEQVNTLTALEREVAGPLARSFAEIVDSGVEILMDAVLLARIDGASVEDLTEITGFDELVVRNLLSKVEHTAADGRETLADAGFEMEDFR